MFLFNCFIYLVSFLFTLLIILYVFTCLHSIGNGSLNAKCRIEIVWYMCLTVYRYQPSCSMSHLSISRLFSATITQLAYYYLYHTYFNTLSYYTYTLTLIASIYSYLQKYIKKVHNGDCIYGFKSKEMSTHVTCFKLTNVLFMDSVMCVYND